MDKNASIVIKSSGDIKIKGQSIKIDAPKINISSANLSINGKATYNGREIARRGDPTTDGASIA